MKLVNLNVLHGNQPIRILFSFRKSVDGYEGYKKNTSLRLGEDGDEDERIGETLGSWHILDVDTRNPVILVILILGETKEQR